MLINIDSVKKYSGTINAPVSKSVAHRLLIAAALSKKDITIQGSLLGDDIERTAECLNAIGFVVTILPNCVKVSFAKFYKKVVLNVGESGSTLRFFLPLVAALGVEAEFCCKGRLEQRPHSPLLDVMAKNGAETTNSPIKVSGKLSGGTYDIDGSISSQFISGLLLALPLLEEDSTINIKNTVVSNSYIDITLSVLELSGIVIEKMPNGYFIKGGQTYNLPSEIQAEGDWSGAAFMACLGVLGGNISILNLDTNSKQGDKAFVELMKKANAKIKVVNNGIVCKKSKLRAITFSATDIPDLVPILSVMLSCAKGISMISDVDRLKDKECDRLTAVLDMLNNFGIMCHYQDNALYIMGGQLSGGQIDGYSDHRMVMSGAIGACIAKDTSIVTDKECVAKSYPDFWHDLESMGAVIYE